MFKRKKVEQLAVERVTKYQAVFGSPDGQWVLEDLMSAHGMMSAHPANPEQMALKEGERLVVLRILTMLKTNPRQLLERIKQHESSLDEI